MKKQAVFSMCGACVIKTREGHKVIKQNEHDQPQVDSIFSLTQQGLDIAIERCKFLVGK